MKGKKKIIILGIISICLVIGGIFFFSSKNSSKNKESKFFPILFPSSQEKKFNRQNLNQELPFEKPEITTQKIKGKLIQLSQKAVVGGTYDNSTKKVIYFEKSNGNIFSISPDGRNKKQISITTIPKIFKVIWSAKKNKAVIFYLKDEEKIASEQRIYSLYHIATSSEGVFLPTNTLQVAASPKKDEIFYWLKTKNKNYGIISDFQNKKRKTIFQFSFGDFLISWPEPKTIIFLTKPSFNQEGYLYKLNPYTGSFSKILGEIKGLTISFSKNLILFSKSTPNSFATMLYNLKKKEISVFPVTTLPEKCLFSKKFPGKVYCAVPIWIPEGNYPDSWYKGEITFNDNLVEINLQTGESKIILENTDFDIINIFSDKEENYLFFQNKKDRTLWSLKITDKAL